MISPLSATTQNHRQALRMEPVALIKQGTKPIMDMVQCKTTNMIEILILDTEINVCVLPLSLSVICSRAAWWERSQPACLVQAPNSSLIVSNNLKNVPINTSWSTFWNLLYFLLRQGLLETNLFRYFHFWTGFFFSFCSKSDKIWDLWNKEHLQLLTYQIWECITKRRLGRGPLLDIWWGLRVDTRAVKETG